jgi:uncharacterized membrane protein
MTAIARNIKRPAFIAAAIAAWAGATPHAFALPLPPAAEVSPAGTTAALRPELEGTVLADTRRRFSVPDGSGGRVRGYLQDTVIRSRETGTLIFRQQLVLDARSSAAVSPVEWTTSDETRVTTDVDYRTDLPGALGASSALRGPTGSTVRYKLPRRMAAGESTRFHDMLTNALAFDGGGRVTISGPGLPPVTLRSYRPAGTPQPYYTATPIGPGSNYALFLNDHGQVSMTVGDSVSGFKTLLWQPGVPNGIDGSAHAIPQLPGYPYNEAGRINNLGQITGTNYTRADRGEGVGDFTQRAYLWTPDRLRGTDGRVDDLGVLPGGSWSYARGINDRGEVTGYGDYPGAATGYADPLLWTAGAVTQFVSPGGGFGGGWALNANGDIAGFGAFGAGTYQGFIWTATPPGGTVGTTVTVDMVGGPEYQVPGSTTDLNDAGVAVGAAVLGWPDKGETHGYIWASSGLTDLGVLEIPASINNAGVAVGSWSGGIARLYRNGVVSSPRWFVSPAQNWALSWASDINRIEQISGAGVSPGTGWSLLLMTPVRIASATPSPCGSSLPLLMTVRGTGFTASATAVMNGARLPTLRVNANLLQVTVPTTVMDGGCANSLFIANDDGTSSTVKIF